VIYFIILMQCSIKIGQAVAQIVGGYKPEGRGFDPGWCHWNISLT
jgi:hypothetical protein